MQLLIDMLTHFPRIKRHLRSIYDFFQGLPPVSYSGISKKLIQECVGKPDPTILEIGCNDGSHTLWFLQIFKNPKVYCFEPDPRAATRFKQKVGQHPNLQLFEIALSDRNGEIEFYQSGGHKNEQEAEMMPDGWDLSGSIRKPKDHLVSHPWIKFDRAITVKTVTLDDWCEEHEIESIDFIWMDVQGAELDIFRGGKKALKKTRFLYTEYSYREIYEGQATIGKLLKYLNNFQILVRYPGDVLLTNKQLEFAPNKAL